MQAFSIRLRYERIHTPFFFVPQLRSLHFPFVFVFIQANITFPLLRPFFRFTGVLFLSVNYGHTVVPSLPV